MSKEQIQSLKDYMGLNISEISAILLIARPTIYEWLENKELKLKGDNQERLNEIYYICQKWKDKKVGQMNSRFHDPVLHKKSLFDLLVQKNIPCLHLQDILLFSALLPYL